MKMQQQIRQKIVKVVYFKELKRKNKKENLVLLSACQILKKNRKKLKYVVFFN